MSKIEELLILSHKISKFTVGAEGNTSVRDGNFFYIKASGFALSTLNENHIIKCDLTGQQLNNFHLKPSLETDFHSLIYRITDARFIAHTHPTETLKILCSNKISRFAKERLFPDHVVFNGEESCVVNYAHPGIELKNAIEKAFKTYFLQKKKFPDLTLLQNHGILCMSVNMKNCIFATEICEKAASVFLSAKTKKLVFLTAEQKQRILNDEGEIFRRMKK